MRLKRSSGSALRSTFIRRMAPSQDDSGSPPSPQARRSRRSRRRHSPGDGGEGRAPLGEDFRQPRPQHLALWRGLETKIANQATATELGPREPARNDVEIASEAVPRAKAAIVQHLHDRRFVCSK
jgi:hypothetical protein